MADGEVDLLVEGDHKESSGPFHQRALGIADIDGHKLRRTVTKGVDQLLCIDHRGNLSVAGSEYIVMESAGDYHCSCDTHFDSPEEALEHLEEVAAQQDGEAS